MNPKLIEQLTNWYNLLDPIDRRDVDVLMSMEKYAAVIDKYETSPGFPTEETIKCE